MAEQQMISAFASSSNSSSTVSYKRYDVFLSFRGEDTRKNITSHLYKALNEKKIETFIDYQLEKGDEISPALIKAIEDSHVSVVILSENYASSKWCLEELSKILECQKNQGQTVIPVFFNIDPSHVRNQTKSYGQAFAKHEGDHRCNKWKTVLTEVANLSGWDSQDRVESELLDEIVGDVLQKLPSKYPNHLEGLVGIEDNYEQIESLLKIGSSDVRTLGIWGMGGIGKTTLAKTLYAKLSRQFDVSCFLENVRENSSMDGRLQALHNKLFSKLLENDNYCSDAPFLLSGFDKHILGRKKVLIVLDDVDTTQQLESLFKYRAFLRPGSKIIVTTRNKQIFHLVVDVYYEVNELSFHHSLKLFCLTAFGEEQPKHGYEDLSRRVISYCTGNPLALKVVGASLRGRSIEAWGIELRKLQEVPIMDIHNVLKISYDGLDCSQKDIFLDIACFFKGKERNSITNLLEASNFFAASGIVVLLDKALITISNYNMIEMHDLIQQMGQDIVLQESIKDPGRRSRIWKPEEVQEVLKYNQGTDVVEGIILDLDKLTENLSLSSDTLAKMTNMRFLKISREKGHMWSKEGFKFNVYFPDGLESLSYKLRYLHWEGFYPESLPSKFCAEQLVEFRMPNSKLTKLWDGIQNVVNLKIIDLEGSKDLIEIPDLSKAERLESVGLDECESLHELHPSMSSLANLRKLSIDYCRGIESLNVHSKSLKKLNAIDCSSLREFLVTSEEMTWLYLSATSIRAIPSSIWLNRKLTHLNLSGFNNVDELSYDSGMGSITAPDHYGCMQHNASEFSSLQALVRNIGHFSSLEMLILTKNNVESLPANIKNLSSLRWLLLSGCRKLVSLLELPPSLTELYLDDCSKLVSLPELPPSLRELDLDGCRKLVSLPELPPLLQKVSAQNCTSLDTDSTQRLLLQHILNNHYKFSLTGHCIFPGDHVTDECGFRTAGSSITIPYLPLPPSSHLHAFIYCVILPKGFCCDVKHSVRCSIYQDDNEVGWDSNCKFPTKLISEHVLFSHVKIKLDYCSDDLPFKFEFYCQDIFEDKHHQVSIKECVVFLVYASESGLKLFDSSSKEIFESESITEISDDESHPRGIGVEGSNNENENEWEQLLNVIASSV